MQIELPDSAIATANQLAADGEDAATVIVRALERLSEEGREVAAVMQGVADYQAGRHQSLEEVDREIRDEFGYRRKA